jgi:hypothetical protein
MDAYGPHRISSLFMHVCDEVGAHLARTDPGHGDGLIQEDELGGALTFIDWFLFLGKALVPRWGIEHLRCGPFHAVLAQPNGGVCLLLVEDPRSEGWSRRVPAEYLGIQLKPIRTRIADKWVELPWS